MKRAPAHCILYAQIGPCRAAAGITARSDRLAQPRASASDPKQLSGGVRVNAYFCCREQATRRRGRRANRDRFRRMPSVALEAPAHAASDPPAGDGVQPSTRRVRPWLLLAAGSHWFAGRSAGWSNQKQLPVRARDPLLLFTAGRGSNAEMQRASGLGRFR
jgi:hypothetical protein